MENEKREVILTADGSSSVVIPGSGITYHSHHGAIQESRHVFIETGLHYILEHHNTDKISIFEMGFGTGLNAFLTAIEAGKKGVYVSYQAIEEYPLLPVEVHSLNYAFLLQKNTIFDSIHTSEWETLQQVTFNFQLLKQKKNLLNYQTEQRFHLIYFDAFGPDEQPELWTETLFEKMFHLLYPGGILVTYCSKSSVRKAMIAAGFTVAKLPGPKGKREIVRAMRPGPPRGEASPPPPKEGLRLKSHSIRN